MTKGSVRVELEWADGEYSFALLVPQIEELEGISANPVTGKNGIGFGAIWTRVMDGGWYVSDLRNTIRLGLIGGGMGAVEANRLCRTYVDGVPVHGPIGSMTPDSPLAVAQSILLAAVAGIEANDDGGEEAEKKRETVGETTGTA